MASNNKSQTNYLNYKIVKCKNWEKDRTCKYGAHCTFAHGDEDLRNKADNLYQMNQMMMFPIMYGMEGIPLMMPNNMDLSQMNPMMNPNNINQNQFMMMNNGMMGQIPEGMNMNGNNNENKEETQ